MSFALAPEAAAAGYGLVVHETIGSTNADATERSRAGKAGPLWVVSRHQSQGRGRRGSAWRTEPGNLAASLLLTLDLPPPTLATLGFVAGLAVVRALEALLPPPCGEGGLGEADTRLRGQGGGGPEQSSILPDPHPGSRPRRDSALPTRGRENSRFTLKWPNDVLLDGAKLAGILLETETVKKARAVVIGIGLNVEHAPEELPYPTACLRDAGLDITAEQLFTALSAEWVRAMAVWDDGRGFAKLRQAWLERAAGLGASVLVRSGEQTVGGVFETIDEHGHLVVRAADRSARRVSAGEVYFGEAASFRGEAA